MLLTCTSWVESRNTRDDGRGNIQILSKTWLSITAWSPFHWSPFVNLFRCANHSQGQLKTSQSLCAPLKFWECGLTIAIRGTDIRACLCVLDINVICGFATEVLVDNGQNETICGIFVSVQLTLSSSYCVHNPFASNR